MRRLCITSIALCILLTPGCQKLSYQGTIEIEKDTLYHEVEFKAPKSEQKMQAKITSNEPVNVYILLGDDKDDAVNTLRAGRSPGKVLASKEKTTDATLDALVPAAKPFVVLIQPADRGKNAKVELEVKGK